jgi:hypothetical protein
MEESVSRQNQQQYPAQVVSQLAQTGDLGAAATQILSHLVATTALASNSKPSNLLPQYQWEGLFLKHPLVKRLKEVEVVEVVESLAPPKSPPNP